jgi:hypothetical protein
MDCVYILHRFAIWRCLVSIRSTNRGFPADVGTTAKKAVMGHQSCLLTSTIRKIMKIEYLVGKAAIVGAVSLLLLAGCATQEGAYPPQATTRGNVETSDNFVLLDSATQQSVTCAGLEQHILGDGRLEAAANVRNRSNARLEVQVSCVFKDDYGFAVDETPFQSLILTENATQTVKFASMNQKAKRFTLRIRQPR